MAAAEAAMSMIFVAGAFWEAVRSVPLKSVGQRKWVITRHRFRLHRRKILPSFEAVLLGAIKIVEGAAVRCGGWRGIICQPDLFRLRQTLWQG